MLWGEMVPTDVLFTAILSEFSQKTNKVVMHRVISLKNAICAKLKNADNYIQFNEHRLLLLFNYFNF